MIKNVFPENIQAITDFSKKTGDYPSLSATDIKVMALAYQIEKEKVGTEHLRTEPVVNRVVQYDSGIKIDDKPTSVTGFYSPEGETDKNEECNERLTTNDENLVEKFATLDCGELDDTVEGQNVNEILASVDDEESADESGFDDEDDDDGWITPSNVQKAKKQMKDELFEDKPVVVACITTDFAMQNVLKQMNLNVSALDGRMIKQIRTFILRCYTCFKTTSLMEKVFCPKCGNKTLKKVAVSLDENGKQVIHINRKRPLTSRGKKFSLPTFKGGKHSNNPIISEDQPLPQQRPSRQARMKNNPLEPDYIAGKKHCFKSNLLKK